MSGENWACVICYDVTDDPRRDRLAKVIQTYGETWRPINRGLRSEFMPDPTAEVGHCVHHVAMHPNRPKVLYMQKHWETLTRFLSVPGAPLDNNLAERALKLFIRQRKNSLFYKNTHSAYIASVLTSLIATCVYAGGNAVEYLVALQEHRSEVFTDPAAWLPWVYAHSRASP